jgi:DNA-binding PadR family transcriptional regulator
MNELDLLRSYESGPRIWDAAAILPGVYALETKGLIEPTGTSGAYQLTEAGREALEDSDA